MRRVLVLILAIAVLLPALAWAASSPTLVPPNQKVSGLTYAQWLGVAWQTIIQHPPSAPACATVHRSLLLLGTPAPSGEFKCKTKANAPVYALGASDECSTVESGASFAKSAAGLKRCAHNAFKATSGVSVSIDGHRVTNLKRFIFASPVFSFRLPANNIFGVKPRAGKSAAYGYGYLIAGLTKGRHTVVLTSKFDQQPLKASFTITAS